MSTTASITRDPVGIPATIKVLHSLKLLTAILLCLDPRHAARCMRVDKRLCSIIRGSGLLRRRLFLPPDQDPKIWWIINQETKTILQTTGSSSHTTPHEQVLWPFVANDILIREICPQELFCLVTKQAEGHTAGACMRLNMTEQSLKSLASRSLVWNMALSQPPASEVVVTWDAWRKDDDELAEPMKYTAHIRSRSSSGGEGVTTLAEIIRKIRSYKRSRFIITSIIICGGICVTPTFLKQVQVRGKFEASPLSMLLTLGGAKCYNVLQQRAHDSEIATTRPLTWTSEDLLKIEEKILGHFSTRDVAKMQQVSKTFSARMLRFPFTSFRLRDDRIPPADFRITGTGMTVDQGFALPNCNGLSKKTSIKKLVRMNHNLLVEAPEDDYLLKEHDNCLHVRLTGALDDVGDSRGRMFLTMPPSHVEVFVNGSWEKVHTIHNAGAMYDDLRFRRDILGAIPRIRIPGVALQSPDKLVITTATPVYPVANQRREHHLGTVRRLLPMWTRKAWSCSKIKLRTLLRRGNQRQVETATYPPVAGAHVNLLHVSSPNGHSDQGISPITGYTGWINCFES